ncbi:MAG: hypothetical protein L3J52_08665 [Proteobacteria bacterium]|nr:hypothetical protein [Pseudomonadota bacterium]
MIKYLWMFVLTVLLLSIFMLTLSILFKTPPLNIIASKAQAKIEFIDIKDLDFHSECHMIGKAINDIIKTPQTCQTNEDCVIGHYICSINLNKSNYQQLKQLKAQEKSLGHCGYTVASCQRVHTNPQAACVENVCTAISPFDLKSELLIEARKIRSR